MSGGQIATIAIPLLAVQQLDVGAVGMGVLAASASTAPLIFGLHAGVIADSFSRKRVMIVCHALRAILIMTVVALIWADALTLPLLSLIVLAVGALELVFFSCLTAVIPGLVPKDRLDGANSWVQGMENTAEVVGPGIAGVIIGRLGMTGALIANVATYIAAGALAATLPKESRKMPEERVHLLSGLRIIQRSHSLRGVAASSMFFNVFSGGFFALFILFLSRSVTLDAMQIGYVGSLGGAGGLAGAAVASKLIGVWGPGRILTLGYTVPGLGGLVIAAASLTDGVLRWIVAGAGLAVWSGFTVILIIAGVGIYQRSVDDSQLGRLNAAMRFLTWGVEPFGALAAGLAAAYFGVVAVLVVFAIGCACAGMFGMLWGIHRYVYPDEGEDVDAELEPRVV